jgi:hypothetical protein
MALMWTQRDPGAQQKVRDHGTESGGQDDGIAEGPSIQEDGGRTPHCSLGRLPPQPVDVRRLQEPSFHGDAG